MNNVIPIYRSEQYQAAEKEKTLNAIKFRVAMSALLRLHQNNDVNADEFEKGREFLANRFHQDLAV